MSIGYGTFIGWSISALWIWLIYRLGIPATPSNLAGSCSLTCLLLFWGLRDGERDLSFQISRKFMERRPPVSHTSSLLGGALVFGLLTLCVLSLTAPVFPWDGWSFWSLQTKHWYYEDNLEFRLSSNYPPFFSLIQLWVCKFNGGFDDSIMNYPFFAMGFASLLAFFSQARHMETSTTNALIGLLVMLATPMFAVHLALHGYADLVTCVGIGLAFMSLLVATKQLSSGSSFWRNDFLLFVVCGLFVALYKRPGVFWALLFIPTAWLSLRSFLRPQIKKNVGFTLGGGFLVGVIAFDKTVGYDFLDLLVARANSERENNLEILMVSIPLTFLLFFGQYALVGSRRNAIPGGSIPTSPVIWVGAVVVFFALLTLLQIYSLNFWSAVVNRALLHALFPAVFALALCLAALFPRRTVS
jgi:hypothetical protein